MDAILAARQIQKPKTQPPSSRRTTKDTLPSIHSEKGEGDDMEGKSSLSSSSSHRASKSVLPPSTTSRIISTIPPPVSFPSSSSTSSSSTSTSKVSVEFFAEKERYLCSHYSKSRDQPKSKGGDHLEAVLRKLCSSIFKQFTEEPDVRIIKNVIKGYDHQQDVVICCSSDDKYELSARPISAKLVRAVVESKAKFSADELQKANIELEVPPRVPAIAFFWASSVMTFEAKYFDHCGHIDALFRLANSSKHKDTMLSESIICLRASLPFTKYLAGVAKIRLPARASDQYWLMGRFDPEAQQGAVVATFMATILYAYDSRCMPLVETCVGLLCGMYPVPWKVVQQGQSF
eukprot:TRINITY_DN14854_c0_g1_i1.p2 TRINITY_DN14854_c0_g1~~TRINITY_DN14854_c0_g1_i1.p2  ORF type:complete len:386 (-),score=88.50 TRINITY_DN14854_c0_g1_i1:1551-2591(-)